MPLQLKVDTLDSVPEALRDSYVETDGGYRLDVDGIEDTTGLKSALGKERERAGTLEKQAKAWNALGKTPEEIAELVKASESAQRKKHEDAGNFDAILKQHQDTWAKERAELERERDEARTGERDAVVSTSLMSALNQGNATKEGLAILPDILAKRINFTVADGKRQVEIMAGDGTPMAGTAGDGRATFADLVKETAQQFPSLFAGSGQSGSGKQPTSGGNGSAKQLSKAAIDKMSHQARMDFFKSGGKMVD